MVAVGQLPHRFAITNITNALPCTVTTAEANEYSTGDFVRLTGLDGWMPVPRGVDELNNNRYRIVVTGTTTFTLQDPITHDPIDSSNFPSYVTGGSVNLIETTFFYYGEE